MCKANYVDTINLSLYKDHFCYITKLELFTKTFACKTCGKSWDTFDHLKRHSASCTNEIKYITVSNQIFKKNDNIIYKLCSRLNSIKDFTGGSHLPVDLYNYDYIITYDFECRFSPLIRNTPGPNGLKLNWLNTNVPLSVASASNYPGINDRTGESYDIKFIYNEDPDELINQMFIYIKELA